MKTMITIFGDNPGRSAAEAIQRSGGLTRGETAGWLP